MKSVRTFALMGAITLLSAAPLAASVISINQPLLAVSDPSIGEVVDSQIVRAIAVAESTYDGVSIGYQGLEIRKPVRGRADIAVDIIVSSTGDGTFTVFNGTSTSGGYVSYAHFLPINDSSYRDFASILGYINGTIGDAEPIPETPLVFFQEFSTNFVSTGDLPFAGVPITPYSISSRDGNPLFGAGTFVLETDQWFREQQKIGLSADMSSVWAYHIGATPAGTIAAGSAAQSGVVRYVPGIDDPFRIRTTSPAQAFTITTDGSILTIDFEQRVTRFSDQGISQIELDMPPGGYVSFMASGPENTFMVWDFTQRAFFIFDVEGNRTDIVIPHLPQEVVAETTFIAAYDNGDLFMIAGDNIIRVRRDGRIAWRGSLQAIADRGQLRMYNARYLNPTTGAVMLANQLERHVIQLLDVDQLSSTRSLSDPERRILESNELLRSNPYDQSLLAERAAIYEELEAWEIAAYTWDTAFGINPGNRDVRDGRDRVETRQLETDAERLYERTIRLLDQFGISSAAYSYQRAQEVFEQLIGRLADPSEAQRMLNDLRERYEGLQNPQRERPPLSLDDIALADIFPSLFTTYQDNPAGTIRVRNTGSAPITDISVQAEMRFLDFATPGGTLARLGPGESAEIDVRLPISDRTLSLQESAPVPVNVTVSYRSGSQEFDESEVEIITVHRATALTWDDSGRLAAYVTPRDSIVAEYAAPFVSVGEAERFAVSEKIFRAARISDAIGVSGLEYIEDPQSGITQVLGDPAALDTVRFPRNTIRVGYGDCDDTTALMCSLFESVGIRTAIMTSPGHVFMAFDTGEPAQNAWLFESDTTAVIEYEGTVWLPYETTILHEGFLASWQEGSRLYMRYEPEGQIEFLPVSAERDRFPAIPLQSASFSVTPPPALLADPLYDESVGSIRDTLYVRTVSDLERAVGSQSARRQVRTWNQIGILHGQFDEPRDAESAFREAIDIDADYAASYVNLANLSIIDGDGRAAIQWLDEADERRSGTVISTLLRAQAEFLLGNRRAAQEQMVLLEQRAPDLAAQYPHLSGSAVGRASEAQSSPSLPWAVDE